MEIQELNDLSPLRVLMSHWAADSVVETSGSSFLVTGLGKQHVWYTWPQINCSEVSM